MLEDRSGYVPVYEILRIVEVLSSCTSHVDTCDGLVTL
jgi:hypothetical protein